MEPNKMASIVDDIVLPVDVVELKHLRRRDGFPVVVGVEAIDELVMAKIMQSLPGSHPEPLGIPKAADDKTPEQSMSEVERILAVAAPLIEAGTFLEAADGTQVRPAFWFTAKTDGRSIRGSLLKVEDKMLLAEALMRVGGYLGGASTASFSGGRERDVDGARAMAPGEVDRDAAVGSGVS